MAGEGQLAREVRTGLDALYFGKPKRLHIREFGCVFGTIFCIVGSYYAWHGNMKVPFALLSATGVLMFASYYLPIVVYPLWSAWMGFAHYLGIVMSFVFVTITWIFLTIPVAMLLRVIGKKVMDLSYDESRESYWEERTDKQNDFLLLERQF